MSQSREESGAKKIADVFADERLNVVQLGYHSSLTFTPNIIEKIKGWIHWHEQISESIEVRDDGGMNYIDGDYLQYIKR